MSPARLSQLLHFYEEDPTDPFNAYALALEYQTAEPARAEAFFTKLLTEFPDYLPTYYHAGQFFAERNDPERAIWVFEAGIALAEKTAQEKALRELRGALQRWRDEWEE
jgi:lipoprotein NlpI